MMRTILLLCLALATAAEARKPTRSDRFWATWDGFEIEAYVAMKELGETMTKLQAEGSIARRSNDSDGESWLKEQVGDKLVDWANDLNPAVKPIKAMSDFAQQKTQAWLDWSFRSKVNTLFRTYKAALRETKDPKQALQRAEAQLDAWLETNMNAKDQKMLAVLKANRGVVLAQLVKTDLELNPAQYPEDFDLTAKKVEVPASVKALPEATQKKLLDCLCQCGSNANQSMVAVYWNPKPDGHSPSCSKPEEGPCMNKGYGCWRTRPAASGDCAQRCARSAGLGQVPAL